MGGVKEHWQKPEKSVQYDLHRQTHRQHQSTRWCKPRWSWKLLVFPWQRRRSCGDRAIPHGDSSNPGHPAFCFFAMSVCINTSSDRNSSSKHTLAYTTELHTLTDNINILSGRVTVMLQVTLETVLLSLILIIIVKIQHWCFQWENPIMCLQRDGAEFICCHSGQVSWCMSLCCILNLPPSLCLSVCLSVTLTLFPSALSVRFRLDVWISVSGSLEVSPSLCVAQPCAKTLCQWGVPRTSQLREFVFVWSRPVVWVCLCFKWLLNWMFLLHLVESSGTDSLYLSVTCSVPPLSCLLPTTHWLKTITRKEKVSCCPGRPEG